MRPTASRVTTTTEKPIIAFTILPLRKDDLLNVSLFAAMHILLTRQIHSGDFVGVRQAQEKYIFKF